MIPGFNGVMDFSKEPGPADRRAFLEVPFSATHADADAESRLLYAAASAASAATSFPEARPPVLLPWPSNRCAVTAGDWVTGCARCTRRRPSRRILSQKCATSPPALCPPMPCPNLTDHALTDRAIPVSAAPLSAQQQVRELEAQCALFRPLVQARSL